MSLPVPFGRERFGEVPFLQGIGEDVYSRLAARGKSNPWTGLYECTFRKGETILREGDYCDGAYYILRGRVSVLFRGGAPAAASTATVVLPELPVDLRPGDRATLGPGEIIGEGSALSRYPIATDIVADSDVACLLIRTPLLRAIFEEPEFAAFKAAFDERYRQRTLRAHLRRVPALQDVPQDLLDELAASAELVSFKPDKVIAQQGAAADALYVVRGGYVKVSVRLGADDLAVSYLRKGDVAGESGLLLDEPWPVSLTALEHVELVKISRERISAVLERRPGLEAGLWRSLTATLTRRSAGLANPLASESLQYAMDSGLIHGESVFLIDLEKCTRCDECVRACADAHAGTPRFVREGSRFRNFSVPTACYHCTDPVCMIGCPTGAITRPLGTMEVAIDARTCIGCGNCVRRCPWDNIQTVAYDSPATGTRINLATKCDLCIGRDAGPACVQMCPHGAAVRVNFKDSDRVGALFAR